MLSTVKTASILVTAIIGKSLAGPTCTEFFFPVTVSAENVVLPISTPPVYQQVSGTYNIGARYCEPQTYVKSRQNTLQILVHGITYTRNYWSGDGEPGLLTAAGGSYDGTTYSWVDFASQRGFPTLSIDRLGNGLSDHPDPTNVLQTPLQVEVNHQIIAKARAGTLPIPQHRSFETIIYGGHSYGSILGNSLNVKYPNDVDATILTGLNKVYNLAFLGTFVTGLAPANTVNPLKWSDLGPGYLALFNQTEFEEAFYYPGFFDQVLVDLDFAVRGTVGVGELDSALALPLQLAAQYTEPILDITGQHDTLMCFGPDPAQSTKPWETYDCGEGTNASLIVTGTLYPNADYQYYAPSESGHCLNFHYSALDTFAYAHNWLSSKGF